MVGKEVLLLCHDISNGKRDISDINDIVVVLIPKIKDHKDMTYFRPISLCKVIFKIISKVLANRLKVVLLSCISQK